MAEIFQPLPESAKDAVVPPTTQPAASLESSPSTELAANPSPESRLSTFWELLTGSVAGTETRERIERVKALWQTPNEGLVDAAISGFTMGANIGEIPMAAIRDWQRLNDEPYGSILTAYGIEDDPTETRKVELSAKLSSLAPANLSR